MTSPTFLFVGAVLLGAGCLVAAFLMVTPDRRALPLARRRPGAAQSPSPLTRIAQKATSLAVHLVGSREGLIVERLWLAGIRMKATDFVVLCASVVIVATLAGLSLGGLAGALLMAVICVVTIWAYVTTSTSKRRAKFTAQLDETLDLLAGGLRAGYSLAQAASTVASESEAPTSEEFTRVINEARMGRSFVEALENCASRVQSQDFDWIVQAVAINREVGGNLAEVLDGVGLTIRERTQLHRQVKSLAAEGKLSAIVLGALPFAVAGMLMLISPGYLVVLTQSMLGIGMVVLAGVLLIIGLLWMSAVIKIKY